MVAVALPAGRQVKSRAPKMYYLYIIRSDTDKKFYTGITDNIDRRLLEHNGHKPSTISTVNRMKFELVYVEECESRIIARKREKFWKSGQGREYRDELFR